MGGFLAPFDEDCWIMGALTVKVDVTLRLLNPQRATNSGPNNVESLLFCSDFLLRHPNTFRSSALLSSSFKRLVMSSLSHPTSSSSAPTSPLLSPLSSSSFSSLSFSSSDSSTIEPLSVRAIQTLPPLGGRCLGDDPEGATDRSASPKQSSPILQLG